jgi:hypothetical protein
VSGLTSPVIIPAIWYTIFRGRVKYQRWTSDALALAATYRHNGRPKSLLRANHANDS